MPQAKNVKNIVKHCTAGFSLIPALQNFWRNTLGWKSAGYHAIIYPNGEIWYITKDGWNYSRDDRDADFTKITNGVRGYNSSILNYAYIGGVENVGTPKHPIWKAKNTQTEAQLFSEQTVLQTFTNWLKNNGKDVTKDLGLVGHRDFSIDKNGNGVIDTWERIKECPSTDVIKTTTHYLYSSKDRYGKLPTVK